MITAYLYLNAGLYALFAAWCTFRWRATSKNLGYLSLDDSGKSEYLVIYGGLQWALAAIFAILARDKSLHAAGVLIALATYLPIVAYRAWTVWRFRPVRGITLMVGALELLLCLCAAALHFTL